MSSRLRERDRADARHIQHTRTQYFERKVLSFYDVIQVRWEHLLHYTNANSHI